MNRLEPAGSHDLRDGASIAAIRLVGHRAHRGFRVPRFNANRRPTPSGQFAMQPGRQLAGLESDAFECQIETFKESMERIRFAACASSPWSSDRPRQQRKSRLLPKTRPFLQSTSWLLPLDDRGDPTPTTFSHCDGSIRLLRFLAVTPITPSVQTDGRSRRFSGHC